MKHFIYILLLLTFQLNGQTIRIAISDFENLSGNVKYDGLGKALSSMLISDIELNVSKKRLQLVERSQLNKILKEQNIQSGKAFDKNSAVKVGKLLGINFVLVGDIFVLNDDLVINARLTSVENGEIKFSNKQTGKLSQWLGVKTKIAKDLSDNLKMPFVEPSILDKEISPGILASYSSAVEEFDKGNFEKAIVISETIKSINPDFNYVDDLKNEIDKIRKEIVSLKKEVETVVENPIEVANNFIKSNDLENAIKYYKIGLSRISKKDFGSKYIYFILLSEAMLSNSDLNNSIIYADSVLLLNPTEPKAKFLKAGALSKQGKVKESRKIIEDLINHRDKIGNSNIILGALLDYSNRNDINLKGLSLEMQRGTFSFDKKMDQNTYNSIRNNYNITDNHLVFKIISNGFEFKQNLNINQAIGEFGYYLEESKYRPKEIAKLIMDLNIGVDTTDLFKSKSKSKKDSGLRANVKTGNLQSRNFVIAKTGQAYEGLVYINQNTDEIYSILSSNSIQGGTAHIQCPCDLLIEKGVYDELAKPNGNIDINNEEHASQVLNSAWFDMIGGEFSASRNKYFSVIKFYIKLSRNLTGSNLKSKDFDLYRMSMINLAHAYLLDKKLKEAGELYNKDVLKNDFGAEWGNMATQEILTKDWEEFVSKKLITQKEIDVFRKTYLKY